RVDHVGEQERAPVVFRDAADELTAHERMQLGVLVDRLIDAHQQPVRFQDLEMLVEIETGADALRGIVHGEIFRLCDHCERNPALAAASRHFSTSPRIRSRSASGVLWSTWIICAESTFRTSGSSRTALIWRLSRLTIAGGVAA